MNTSSETSNSNIAKGGREKLNNCNQCEYASGKAENLRKHMKTHYGEKSYKCSQCDFATVHASSLRALTLEKNCTHATNATLHLYRQAI